MHGLNDGSGGGGGTLKPAGRFVRCVLSSSYTHRSIPGRGRIFVVGEVMQVRVWGGSTAGLLEPEDTS
jgi:hypothetical protein